MPLKLVLRVRYTGGAITFDSHHDMEPSSWKFLLLPLFINQNNQVFLQKDSVRIKQKTSLVLLQMHVPSTPRVTIFCLRLSYGVLLARRVAIQQKVEKTENFS